MEIVQGGYTIRKMVAGSGGGSKGAVAVVSSGTAVKATTNPSAGTVLGIFAEDASAGGTAYIAVPDANAIIRTPYDTDNSATLDDDDLGTAFALADEESVDIDETSNGVAVCQGYDNDNGTIDFVFTKAAMYW